MNDEPEDNVVPLFKDPAASEVAGLLQKASNMERILIIGDTADGNFHWFTSEEDLQWLVFALETTKKSILDQLVVRTK